MNHNIANDFSLLIDHLVYTQPSTILDIGVGTGINGLIAREILESRLNVRRDPSTWQIKIDGIVSPATGTFDHLNQIYDQIHVGQPQDIISHLPPYDLVVIKGFLETLPRAVAMKFLEDCMRCSNGHVIVVVPIGKFAHALNPNHPWFSQSSYWYAHDFDAIAPEFQINDSPVGPSGIFPISKEAYFNHRVQSHGQANKDSAGGSEEILDDLQITRSAVGQINLSEVSPYIVEKQDLDYFMDLNFKEHYRLIAYLSTRFDNTCIFDIGTNKGYSALALSYNSSNQIISYDIENLRRLNGQPESNRIEFLIGDVLEDERLLSAPLIMLDTDHDGTFENQFYQFLKSNQYNGFLFLDDIHLNNAMIRFWNSITEPKVDLTDIGHFSGSGLVDFSKASGATGRQPYASVAAVAG